MVRVLINVPKRVKRGEAFDVKLLISHPMESGQRRDGAAERAREGVGRLDRTGDRILGLDDHVARCPEGGEGIGDTGPVRGGQDGPEDGHAEGTTHLAGGVVHGRAHARLGRRE